MSICQSSQLKTNESKIIEREVDVVDCININHKVYWCYRPIRPTIFLNSNPNLLLIIYLSQSKNAKSQDQLSSIYNYANVKTRVKVIVKTSKNLSKSKSKPAILPSVYNSRISNTNDELNRSSTIVLKGTPLKQFQIDI
jgi:hypothetical protein